mmetsp:Transcript_10453/g.20560  ORF Transcript_10453/g.20560 Transcript_10453/m.20560 type:complete len:372 (+) Transcript_10453:116-1231(+)
MSGANKPAMKRIGYFGEEGYMTIGDPYKTKVVETMPRYKGAQFQTNPKFKNRFNLNNGVFGKAPSLYAGEKYITLEQFQRREKNKLKSKQVSETPFRPTNPPKAAMGNLGSNYGTVGYVDKTTPSYPVGGRILYMPQGDGKKRTRADVTHELLNIVTNPMKKGTFGFANTTMGVPMAAGARRGWKGVVGEYAYLPDPYEGAKIALQQERKNGPKNVSEEPFRPGNPSKKGGPGQWGGHRAIAGHPKDCGGCISTFHEYIPTGIDKKKTRADVLADMWKDPYDRPAFRPSNPARKGGPGYWGCGKKGGGCGTMSSFPEAMPDPYESLRAKLLEEKKAKREQMGAMGDRPAFNSMSFGRSKCTPSVFTMNIRI